MILNILPRDFIPWTPRIRQHRRTYFLEFYLFCHFFIFFQIIQSKLFHFFVCFKLFQFFFSKFHYFFVTKFFFFEISFFCFKFLIFRNFIFCLFEIFNFFSEISIFQIIQVFFSKFYSKKDWSYLIYRVRTQCQFLLCIFNHFFCMSSSPRHFSKKMFKIFFLKIIKKM